MFSRQIAWRDFKGLRYYNSAFRLLYKVNYVDIDKDFLEEEDLNHLEEEVKLGLAKK